MKRNNYILLVLVLLFGMKLQAQNVFYTKLDQANRFYTYEDLEEYGKGALVRLYLKRSTELTKVLPFIALTNKPDQRLRDIGVKASAENEKLLKKYQDNTKKIQLSNAAIISEFVAYADSDKLIWSILYMEEIIKKLRLGFKGNF